MRSLVIVAALVAVLVAGTAATALGGPPPLPGVVRSAATSVALCDFAGVAVRWSTRFVPTFGGYGVDAVDLADVPPACSAQTITFTLQNRVKDPIGVAVVSIGPWPGLFPLAVPFSPAVPAAEVYWISVAGDVEPSPSPSPTASPTSSPTSSASPTASPTSPAAISVSQAVAGPGSQLHVDVAGFQPGTLVRIVLVDGDGTEFYLGTYLADENGRAHVDVAVPPGATTGSAHIEAGGTDILGNTVEVRADISLTGSTTGPTDAAPAADGAAGTPDPGHLLAGITFMILLALVTLPRRRRRT